ncbi:MAG TPA: hypoxanthine-guanine phosphoribosyltransferase [Burkholderiales bacterium]|nr:hypoxanthine-guanine phosphoribosyltransferase [Burkholderiales bacterium]
MLNPSEAWQILYEAELIHSAEEVNQAILQLALDITADYTEKNPLILTVMNGGIMFAGQLLPLLRFPLSCDYIHASRYRNATRGGELEWIALPREPVQGRHVLLLDDILDEGQTLAAIKTRLLSLGAQQVACAVLTNKNIEKSKPVRAEYIGLNLPDRFVFGCGMDVFGAWRNLPAIYALKAGAVPGTYGKGQ